MRFSIRMIAYLVFAFGMLAAGHAGSQELASAQIERGRYLSKIGGCNDCHTAGYLLEEGHIPEADWLLGDTFGWRGPWGTTYASNLRLLIGALSEEQWLTLAKNLRTRPPMPWFTLNEMADEDLRALYAYLRSLGSAGATAPAYVPPDREPPPPYALFPSPPPAG